MAWGCHSSLAIFHQRILQVFFLMKSLLGVLLSTSGTRLNYLELLRLLYQYLLLNFQRQVPNEHCPQRLPLIIKTLVSSFDTRVSIANYIEFFIHKHPRAQLPRPIHTKRSGPSLQLEVVKLHRLNILP